MGQAKNRKKVFLEQHALCVYCGQPSETEDHCPPRAMFINRQWPEGFVFPSCYSCNSGSSNDDLIVSFMARQNPFEDGVCKDGRTKGLLFQLKNQVPGFLREMLPSANESRAMNKELGIKLPKGMTHQQSGVVKVIPAMDAAVQVVAKKLTKGIYWKETGKVFPITGEVALYWFTNTDLFTRGSYHGFEVLNTLDGYGLPVVRTSRHLNDQFKVRVSISSDHNLMALGAEFGKSFGFITFSSLVSGQMTKLLEKTRSEEEFSVEVFKII